MSELNIINHHFIITSFDKLAYVITVLLLFRRLCNSTRLQKCDLKQLFAMSAVTDAVKEAESSLGKTGRVLLRKSGTEPLIRVMVESDDEMQSLKWAEFIADAVRKVAN